MVRYNINAMIQKKKIRLHLKNTISLLVGISHHGAQLHSSPSSPNLSFTLAASLPPSKSKIRTKKIST